MKKKLIADCLLLLVLCNYHILIKAEETDDFDFSYICSTTKFVMNSDYTVFEKLNSGHEMKTNATQEDSVKTNQNEYENDNNDEEESCCPGYSPTIFHYKTHDLIQCEPICTTPCPVHQFCVEPDTCVGRNELESETCNKATCVNGCLYPRDLKTKDYCLCPSGYEHTKESTCSPVCKKKCRLGVCIAPDTCACSHGYKLVSISNEQDICEPVCNPPCANSVCIAPNYCQCEQGFTSVQFTNGSSVCQIPCDQTNCRNGSCINNECQCESGYQFDHSSKSCIARCQPQCVSGYCATPNVCVCHSGYAKQPDARNNICCHESCVKSGGTCGTENNCECTAGYKNSSSTGMQCVPDCGDKCTQHEVCVAPGECQCSDGYTFKNGICTPHCHICDNGNCTAPGVCVCNLGFVMDAAKSGICTPVCDPPCVNGICAKPNYCECEQGFTSVKFTNGSSVCQIPCDQTNCRNGSCINNECQCESGYQFDQSSKSCIAQCQPQCVSGYCATPNVCVCHSGYAKQPDARNNICCHESCVKSGGTCGTDNNCECTAGYKNSSSTGMQCVPDCGDKCTQHEVCVAPGECQCRNGYVKGENEVCTPYCQSCQNGNCIDPNTCRCNDGFVLRDGDCVSYGEKRVALWCSLTIEREVGDMTVSFKSHEKSFSCYSTEPCSVTCHGESYRNFTTNRNGFLNCNVTTGADRELGRLFCYGIDVLNAVTRSHGQCSSTLINRMEHKSVYAFFVNFTMSKEVSRGTTNNCSMCPCPQKTNVSVYGVSVEANICPCSPDDFASPSTANINEKYITRIYLLLLTILISLIMIAIGQCFRRHMCRHKHYSADIANTPTNFESPDDGVKLNHIKYNYQNNNNNNNNNNNSNDYKVI